MNTEQSTAIRTKIVRLTVGDQVIITVPTLTNADIQAEAAKFCRAKRTPCTFEHTPSGLLVKRIQEEAKINLYPDIDALAIGQSKLFELPQVMHQKVRMAAGYRAQSGAARFACTREGEFIRVTRLPMTDSEAASCGPIQAPARATKYDLERLSSVRELRFDVTRQDQSKLRLAVHRQIIKTGWTIRCRLQDDGSMLVYRTDASAPAPAMPTGDSASP